MLQSGIPLQKAFKIENLQSRFLEPTAVRLNVLSINMRESEKAIATGCRQHVRVIWKTELGVRKSNALESASSEIVQSQAITCFCTTKITNQITITIFARQKITNQITITSFARI